MKWEIKISAIDDKSGEVISSSAVVSEESLKNTTYDLRSHIFWKLVKDVEKSIEFNEYKHDKTASK